jgi:hypothetical protein
LTVNALRKAAASRGSSFWMRMRPIPARRTEVLGLQRQKSIAVGEPAVVIATTCAGGRGRFERWRGLIRWAATSSLFALRRSGASLEAILATKALAKRWTTTLRASGRKPVPLCDWSQTASVQ